MLALGPTPAAICSFSQWKLVDVDSTRPAWRLEALSRRAFPTQTIRDLIGIARLLYRTWSSTSRTDTRLPKLVAIGKDLQQSLVLARNSKPGTRQYREAWELAELATRRLGYIVDPYVGVKPLITAAFDRVDETAGEDKVAKARRR